MTYTLFVSCTYALQIESIVADRFGYASFFILHNANMKIAIPLIL